jgi:hypothetical protein
MGLSYSEQYQLYRIQNDIFQSAPRLAAGLREFTTVSAGQPMPTWEQVPTRLDRARQAVTRAAGTVVFAVTAIGLLPKGIRARLLAARKHNQRDRAVPGQLADGRPDPADGG